MADVGKLSASKITTYKGCSFAYYLKYEKHEKVPENLRMTFGKRIHYMLERFYDVKYKSADSFANFWKYDWFQTVTGEFLKGKQKKELETKDYLYIVRNKETKEREEKIMKIGSHVDVSPFEDVPGIIFGYMKLGESILKKFYIKHKNRTPPLEKESCFGVKKDDLFNINGHLIRGVFDRIDLVNGEYYITDYKTDKSSPVKDSFYLHRSSQFTLYSYAFRKIFSERECKNIKEKAMLFYHLRDGIRYETHRSEKDYDYLKFILDEVSEGISKDKFVPFYGFHCGFCDQKVVCDKYAIEYRGGPRIDLENRIKPAKTFEEWDIELPSGQEWIEEQESA